jgi:hypothetical protein
MVHTTSRGLRAAALSVAVAGMSLAPTVSHAAGGYISLSAYSGYAGQTITVSGGNFAPNASIVVFTQAEGLRGPGTAAGTTDASGNLAPVSFTIPAVGAGALTIDAYDGASTAANSYYVQPYFPTLTLSTGSTTPFSTVGVSGSGFAPNEGVVVSLGSVTANATADQSGSFIGVSLNVPSIKAGTYSVTGVGQTSGATGTGYLYIGGFFPSISPSSYYLMPGQTLGFNGSGFAPGETVTVSQGTSTLGTFTADQTGSFTDAGSVTIPFSAAGTSPIYTLTGATSSATATTSTNVGGFFANVSPSAFYVLPGATVTFSGSGFSAGETIDITQDKSSTVIGTITADVNGDFKAAGAITLPYAAAGTTPTYHLVGQSSGASSSVQLTVGQFFPNANPSAYYLMPGATVTFSGSGFIPGETVNVTEGTSIIPLTTIIADQYGNFSAAGSVTIPYTASGSSLNYTLTGATSGASVAAPITVGSLYPQLNPSSYYLLPGSPFTATGSGFVPGETVNLTLGGTAIGSALADGMGNVTFASMIFPASTKSSLDLVATGETSLGTVTDTVSVGQYYPYASASNYYVTPGTAVTLTAGGFAPGETVTASNGNATQDSTAVADQYGDVSGLTSVAVASAPVDGMQSNVATVTLTGNVSTASVAVQLTLAPFMTQISPSTYYATPGSSVTFSGSGFIPGETVTLNQGTTALTTATADTMGNVSGVSATLPYGATNGVTYSLVGATSSTPAMVTVGEAAFYAGLNLSSYYANGGTAETITGTGFAPNEVVNLTWDGASIGSATSDGKGTISLATTVPFATPGDKKIVATGVTSGTVASTDFTLATTYSSFQLGSYAIAPGGTADLIGTGFLPGETVDISTSETTGTVYSVTADQSGSFNDSGFVLPAAVTSGPLTITATGEHSLSPETVSLYVTGA